jgi:tRNA modification GTPase
MWEPDDLIVASATVPGRGVRSIIRLSGEGLDGLLEELFVLPKPLPAGPRAIPVTLRADRLGGEWGAIAIEILRWPGPAGPTGGPLAELQLPCSQPLVEAIVGEACRLGARLARGGEFTLRAFLTGKLDLLQAEAVLAVVDARSPGELSQALDRLAGGVGRDLQALRERLLDLTADVEAAIDFADERSPDSLGETSASFWGGVIAALGEISRAVEAAMAKVEARDAGARGRLPRVVICGPPNIGKSSLYNALIGREAALVADEEGTTRDWLEAVVRGDAPCLAGQPGAVEWLLIDTAGVGTRRGERPDPLEAPLAAAAADVGIVEIGRAEIVLRCRDPGAGPGEPEEIAVPRGAVVIDILTRCDRGLPSGDIGAAIATSATTGLGLDRLRRDIAAAVASLPRFGGAAERIRAGLVGARQALAEAKAIAAVGLAGGPAEEPLLAEALMAAIDAIGMVTGHTIGTDLLDRIFSRHCVGK